MNTLELSIILTLVIWALGVLAVCLAMLILIRKTNKEYAALPNEEKANLAIASATYFTSVYPYLSGLIIPKLGITRSLVIGYANIPTTFSTPKQLASYPTQLLLFVYDDFHNPVMKLLTERELEGLSVTVVPMEESLVFNNSRDYWSHYAQNNQSAAAIDTYLKEIRHLIEKCPYNSIWINSNTYVLKYELPRILKITSNIFKVTRIQRQSYDKEALDIIQEHEAFEMSWGHHTSCQCYNIVGYATRAVATDGLIYVVYANTNNSKVYTRPAGDWLRSMTLIEDPNSVSKSKKILKAFRLFEGTD